MPAFETMDLYDRAQYWPRASVDRYGALVPGTREEISVRWNTNRRVVPGPQGEPLTLEADVVVDRDVSPGDVLWHGELADWLGTGSGDAQAELMEVVGFRPTDDIKHRNVRRTVSVMRFRGTL